MGVHLPLVSPFVQLVESFLHQALKLALFLSLLFAGLHRLGVIQRVIHRLCEDALSQVLNGAQVTISKIEVDIITGQFVATDAIIHTPDCDKWRWDSPFIARFGRVTGKLSVLSLLDPLAKCCGYTWREIYYIICEDIQVFIEKRRNIFNFHLLDESLHIPEPLLGGGDANNSNDMSSSNNKLDCQNHKQQQHVDSSSLENQTTSNSSLGVDAANTNSNNTVAVAGEGAVENSSSSAAEKKANEIVSSMLKTVSIFGKAANKGGKNELDRLLKNQRDSIVKTLREFQDKGIISGKPAGATTTATEGVSSGNVSSTTTCAAATNTPSNTNSSGNNVRRQGSVSSMEVMARESLKVVRSMGKAVERNVSEIQQSLKPPQKKDGFKSPDEWIRIGWLTVRDVRIFTKDVILSSGNNNNNNNSSPNKVVTNSEKDPSNDASRNYWSEPILLKEVSFGGTDFSNPVSVRDDNGLPVIGLKADQLVDILVRRALSELAKSNTGRLFSNAMGEFFAWMDNVGNNNNSNNNINQ